MVKFLIAALLTIGPVAAQTPQTQPKPRLTDREQVQSDRAEAAAEEKDAPTARPWDRDANGKRPWETHSPSK